MHKFTFELLGKICQEYGIELIGDYSNMKISRDTRVTGKCKTEGCMNIFEREFRLMYKSKLFLCKQCTTISAYEKSVQTNLRKFGCRHSSQNPIIKEKIKKIMIQNHGCDYPLQNPIIKEKTRQTNLKNRGYEYPSQDPKVKEKIKQVNLEKRGCENPTQDFRVRDKVRKTMLLKYGVEYITQNSEIQEKIKQTSIKKCGYESHFQNPKVREKITQTNIRKYGCEYPMQNAEIAERSSKNAYKLKDFVMPSGRKIKLQGYESRALVELLKVYDEDDIVFSREEVPEIWYADKDGKKHRHFVDFYVKSINRCFEVKSTWTYQRNEEKVLAKRSAAINSGFNYIVWIYNKKELEMIILNFMNVQFD